MSQNSDTSITSMSCNASLPRGLIARSGAQNASTQRLPSLRSESHSSQAILASNSMPITTKGGVLKRTFKPTIPVRRQTNEDHNKSGIAMTDNSANNRRGKQSKNNSRNRGKANDKKFVQLEAAVFSGANNPELRSSHFNDMSSNRKRSSLLNETKIKTEVKAENRSDERFDSRHVSKVKLENKAAVIRKLYGDNFVDDNEGDEDLILPKGWESVSSHRVSSQSNAEPLNPYNLLKTENQEKLLLMQIPEAFLQRPEGLIGKLRVYKSGRVELLDSESGIKFDIVFDQKINLSNVKQENKFTKQIVSNQSQDLIQDVVSFSGNNLSVLGTIEDQQVLLAVPQIPLDDHIGPIIPV